MEVRFELLTVFRDRLGSAEVAVEAEDLEPGGPLLPALQAFDRRFAARGAAVLEGGALRPGVLLFLKDPAGTTTRVRSAFDPFPPGTRAILLSTGMEGG